MEKKRFEDFLTDNQSYSITPKLLKKVLDYSLQHRNMILGNIYKHAPERWGSKTLSEDDFYQKLAVILNDNIERDFYCKDIFKILKDKKYLNRAIIFLLPLRAFDCARAILKKLDFDSYLNCKSNFDLVSQNLKELGHPEFEWFTKWCEVNFSISKFMNQHEKPKQSSYPEEIEDAMTKEIPPDCVDEQSTPIILPNNYDFFTLIEKQIAKKPIIDSPEVIIENWSDALKRLDEYIQTLHTHEPNIDELRQLLSMTVSAITAGTQYAQISCAQVWQEIHVLLNKLNENPVFSQQFSEINRILEALIQDKQNVIYQIKKIDWPVAHQLRAQIEICKKFQSQLEDLKNKINTLITSSEPNYEKISQASAKANQIDQNRKDAFEVLRSQLNVLITFTQCADKDNLYAKSMIKPIITDNHASSPPSEQIDIATIQSESVEPHTTKSETPTITPEISNIIDTVKADNPSLFSLPPELLIESEKLVTDSTTISIEPSDNLISLNPNEIQQELPANLPSTTKAIDWPQVELVIWEMMAANRISLAYHLGRVYETRPESAVVHGLPQKILTPMLHALALAPLVNASVGPVVEDLRKDFEKLLVEVAQQTPDEVITMLLLAATLQASLLAPQTTTAINLLESLPLSTDGNLAELKDKIVKCSRLGVDLSLGLLRGTANHFYWEQQLDDAKNLLLKGWEEKLAKKLSFQRATAVWRHWLNHDFLSHIKNIVEGNDSTKYSNVETYIRKYSNKDQIDLLMVRTDENLRRQKKADPIEGRARQEIFNHTQEALELAQNWLNIVRNPPNQNTTHEFFNSYRSELLKSIRSSREVLNGPHKSPTERAAKQVLTQQLNNLEELFTSDKQAVLLPPWFLLNGDLLKSPDIPFADTPENQHTRLQVLLGLAQNDVDWLDAINQQLKHGNIGAARKIIEVLNLKKEIDAQKRSELEDKCSKELDANRRRLERQIGEIRKEIEKATVDDLITESERDEFINISNEENRLEIISDFRKPFFRLKQIREAIKQKADHRITDIKQRLLMLRKQSPEQPEIIQRIETLLENHDPRTANEYISMLENGDTIPTTDNQIDYFRHFFPVFVKQAGEYFNTGNQNLQTIRHDLETGTINTILNTQSLSRDYQEAVDEILNDWLMANRTKPSQRRPSDRDFSRIRNILTKLLLGDIESFEPRWNSRGEIQWFDLTMVRTVFRRRPVE